MQPKHQPVTMSNIISESPQTLDTGIRRRLGLSEVTPSHQNDDAPPLDPAPTSINEDADRPARYSSPVFKLWLASRSINIEGKEETFRPQGDKRPLDARHLLIAAKLLHLVARRFSIFITEGQEVRVATYIGRRSISALVPTAK